ncbi:MAG: ABC transporter transmembrane domain-containing protein [Alphaproteobacteria bacterium]
MKSGTFRTLLPHLYAYKSALIGVVIALAVAAATVISLGSGLRFLIDEGFAKGSTELLNQALILLVILVGIMAIASFARSYLSAWLGERLVADLKQKLYAHLLYLDMSFFTSQHVGDIQARLHQDAQELQSVIGGAASTGLRSLLQFIGAMIMLFVTSVKLAAITCLIIPLTLLPIGLFGRQLKAQSAVVQDARGQITNFSSESLQNIYTLQATNNEHQNIQQFSDKVTQTLAALHKRIFAHSLLAGTVIFLVFTAISLVLWQGGQDVLQGEMTSGQLIAFVFYAAIAAGSINSMQEMLGECQGAIGAWGRVQEVLSATPKVQIAKSPRSLSQPVEGNIEIRAIDFFHGEARILSDVSLSVKKGETIAIVGPSGSGKTTLFNLILRFYDPAKGGIYIDGVDTSQLSLEDLRSIIGWVPQDPGVFSGTVTDNIRIGSPNAAFAKVQEAAKQAHALEFIQALPKGFNTPLGDRGSTLSGGQRQRIAIARAIIRDPKILLLDEATNALDAESEHHVQQALQHLMRGRTTLIVAHRLSTVLQADRIAVMDKGQIIALGPHTTLMRECALYRRFASLQFEGGES